MNKRRNIVNCENCFYSILFSYKTRLLRSQIYLNSNSKSNKNIKFVVFDTKQHVIDVLI